MGLGRFIGLLSDTRSFLGRLLGLTLWPLGRVTRRAIRGILLCRLLILAIWPPFASCPLVVRNIIGRRSRIFLMRRLVLLSMVVRNGLFCLRKKRLDGCVNGLLVN